MREYNLLFKKKNSKNIKRMNRLFAYASKLIAHGNRSETCLLLFQTFLRKFSTARCIRISTEHLRYFPRFSSDVSHFMCIYEERKWREVH